MNEITKLVIRYLFFCMIPLMSLLATGLTMHSTNSNISAYSVIKDGLPIVVASDHAGLELKTALIKELKAHGIEVIDVGCHEGEQVDYPDYAKSLTKVIKNAESKYGILVCGTGIGMSIAANREKYIRAALCTTEKLAHSSRSGNDANVLVLGSKNTSQNEAILIMRTFFSTKFLHGKHERRVAKMS